jgi:hypothetical protein
VNIVSIRWCFKGFKPYNSFTKHWIFNAEIALMIGYIFPKKSLKFREDHAITYAKIGIC